MADVSIIITIPSSKVAVFVPWYLAERPIPQIPDPDNPGEMIDEYNLKEWVKIELISRIKLICRRGKDRLDRAADLATWDDDIVNN